MARQEQGIETYETPSGEKRYRVRWWEGGKHPSKSFRRLSGKHGARVFYQRIRQAQESGAKTVQSADQAQTLAEFVAEVYPRLARRAPLSVGAGVPAPPPARPTLTLEVSYVDGDAVEYRLDWVYPGGYRASWNDDRQHPDRCDGPPAGGRGHRVGHRRALTHPGPPPATRHP